MQKIKKVLYPIVFLFFVCLGWLSFIQEVKAENVDIINVSKFTHSGVIDTDSVTIPTNTKYLTLTCWAYGGYYITDVFFGTATATALENYKVGVYTFDTWLYNEFPIGTINLKTISNASRNIYCSLNAITGDVIEYTNSLKLQEIYWRSTGTWMINTYEPVKYCKKLWISNCPIATTYCYINNINNSINLSPDSSNYGRIWATNSSTWNYLYTEYELTSPYPLISNMNQEILTINFCDADSYPTFSSGDLVYVTSTPDITELGLLSNEDMINLETALIFFLFVAGFWVMYKILI